MPVLLESEIFFVGQQLC